MLKKLSEIIEESHVLLENYSPHHEPLYHGSFSGDLRGGASGLHLGTKNAAREALESRIGIRADGKDWDGTQEYGKTKLAGKNSIDKIAKDRGSWNTKYNFNPLTTGRNCHIPDHDYYPHEHPEGHLTHADGSKADYSNKPSIEKYKLTGKMTNTVHTPHTDTKANSMMAGQIKKGNAKKGYYYKNDGEDVGSISAVVPNGSHVEKVD